MLVENQDYNTTAFNFNNSDVEGFTMSQVEPIETNISPQNETSSPLITPLKKGP